jgi:hypothetical protein
MAAEYGVAEGGSYSRARADIAENRVEAGKRVHGGMIITEGNETGTPLRF